MDGLAYGAIDHIWMALSKNVTYVQRKYQKIRRSPSQTKMQCHCNDTKSTNELLNVIMSCTYDVFRCKPFIWCNNNHFELVSQHIQLWRFICAIARVIFMLSPMFSLCCSKSVNVGQKCTSESVVARTNHVVGSPVAQKRRIQEI